MEIEVKREPSNQGATLGSLSIDGVFECYTLEDQVREPKPDPLSYPYGPNAKSEWVASWKVQNVTAIPRGRYRIVLHDSPHFGCMLPHLLDVPGYEWVLIHWGNYAKDTDGCILVGQTKDANLIYKSKAAFGQLLPKIEAALSAGVEVWITVS